MDVVIFCAVVALLFAKAWMVETRGNITPYWDQWDGEAEELYKPYLEGRLSIANLAQLHNEHRIITTRMLFLGLFEVQGRRWNPMAQMYLNALLHVASVLLFLLFAQSALLPTARWILWFFAAALFVIPFGWENTLAGFQAQFYLLLLLSVGLVWICSALPASKRMYLAALSLAALLPLTMAGGSLAVIAGAAVLFARRFLGREDISFAPISGLLVIALAGILTTPSIEGHAALKASSLPQFSVAVGALTAWPLSPAGANALSASLPVLMQVPLALGLLVAFHHRETESRSFLFFLAMALWLGLQVAALAYGRGLHCLESRYLDILSFGVVTNFAGLLFLWSKTAGRWRTALAALSAAWLVALLYGIWSWWPIMSEDIRSKAAYSRVQERNVRGYLTTGQREWLHDAAFLEIPYPSPDQLQQLLDDQTIRAILPRQLFISPGPNERPAAAPLEGTAH
jgi:hypothetical protein